MNITVTKVDDINIIFGSIVDNSLLEKKISKLKAQESTKVKSISEDRFQREAEGQILHDFIESGMKEANLTLDEILGQPNFKTYEKHDDGLHLEVEIATKPQIDTDVEYRDIIPEYTKPTIDPKAVDDKLEEMARQHAPFAKIEKVRAVQNGDLVVIDFEGTLHGRALEGANEEKYHLKIGSKSFIAGFEEQVIGMQTGEEKTIKITFPQDYQSKALAGQETVFNVKLHEIHEQQTIELNDALAQKIFKDEKATLASLKEKMTEKITSQAFSNIYNEVLKPQIIKGLLTKFDFTLPNNAVEQEIDVKINEKAQRMSQEEHALYKENKDKLNELRDSLREEARNSIKTALIVDALAKKEGIEVDDDEVLSALSLQAMMTGQNAQELVEYYKENNLMTAAKVGLIEDKLFGKMLGINNN